MSFQLFEEIVCSKSSGLHQRFYKCILFSDFFSRFALFRFISWSIKSFVRLSIFYLRNWCFLNGAIKNTTPYCWNSIQNVAIQHTTSIDIILHYVTHLRSNLSRKTLLWTGLSFYLWANCVFAHKIRWIFFMEADSAQQFSPINEHFFRLSLAWDRNSQFYVLHFTTNVRE